jgi:hypothetical protein
MNAGAASGRQAHRRRSPRSGGQVSGEVDLEPVPRECVMPQHYIAIARAADVHVAAEAQDTAPTVNTRTWSSSG